METYILDVPYHWQRCSPGCSSEPDTFHHFHDFYEVLDGLGIKYLIYTDDIFFYCFDDSLTVCYRRPQEAFRMIAQWSYYWKLAVLPHKYYAINLSRRKAGCNFDFSIHGGLSASPDEMKFLGF